MDCDCVPGDDDGAVMAGCDTPSSSRRADADAIAVRLVSTPNDDVVDDDKKMTLALAGLLGSWPLGCCPSRYASSSLRPKPGATHAYGHGRPHAQRRIVHLGWAGDRYAGLLASVAPLRERGVCSIRGERVCSAFMCDASRAVAGRVAVQ